MYSTQAFILLTNKFSDPVMNLYHELQSSTIGLGDTFIAYHQTSAEIPDVIKHANYFIFTSDILERLNYTAIENTLIPGSNHFPLLDFYLKNPFYENYWYIENDVRFQGDWGHFFNYFSKEIMQPDFISCHLRNFQEEPDWRWWNTLKHRHSYIPLYLRIRSFNPIFRISNAALKFIHFALMDKWQGHHEVLLPTLLYLEGFRIEDFGGTGRFVKCGQEDKFYITSKCGADGYLYTGTMRYRPVIESFKMVQNKLNHPVKL